MKAIIKHAFENTVMCARSHAPQEAYEYAARMEKAVLKELVIRLKTIESRSLVIIKEQLNSFIEELEQL